jgi:hypothetical protein
LTCTPAEEKNGMFWSTLPLCLSRACLGKHSVFTMYIKHGANKAAAVPTYLSLRTAIAQSRSPAPIAACPHSVIVMHTHNPDHSLSR